MKRKVKQALALCLTFTMLFGSTITANAKRSEKTAAETTTEVTAEKAEKSVETVVETEDTEKTAAEKAESEETAAEQNSNAFQGENFKVSFDVTSKWNTAFNANITITNTSDTLIDNWAVQFDMPYEITNIWKGVIDSNESGTYIIKNAGYNQDINPGSSVCFGFTAKTTEENIVYPASYKLLGTQTLAASDTYEISFKVTSDWQSAFNGEIKIKNISEEPIEDWQLEFDFEKNITRFWTADMISHEGNHYVIKNKGYNANIQPGKTLVLGFNGNPGNVEARPENYVLTYVGMEIDYEADTDGDGIPDYFEGQLGTDKKKADTDGDGLSDYVEAVSLDTDPTKKDTDGNGVLDSGEDADDDGLSNLKEIELGTNPMNDDSDAEGLLDGEEVNTYGTDPLKEDTDEDGLTDYEEVQLEFDPQNNDSDGDGTPDSEEKIQQNISQDINNKEKQGISNVTVLMNAAGYLPSTTEIEDMYGKDILSGDVVGLLGVPVKITSTSDFDEATITFTYDESKLGDTNEDNLAIMWYDEENGFYKVLENSVLDKENNTVSVNTTHFSTYMVVDKQAWYKVWADSMDMYDSEDDDSQTYVPYYISFVVDDSGSMSWNGRVETAKEALKRFINHLSENDSANFIKFTWNATKLCDFTNDKQVLLSCVDELYASGGTRVSTGLQMSIDDFNTVGNDKSKAIVLICDGDVDVTASNDMITQAKNQHVKIYPVLIGNGSYNSDEKLQGIADATYGTYFKAQTTEEIIDSLYRVQGETLAALDKTDTDGDGVYDICETAGMMLPNGRVITTDPLNRDSDGDGLTDGEELGKIKLVKDNEFLKLIFKFAGLAEYDIAKYCRYFNYTSDPNKVDSDGGNWIDTYDSQKLKINISHVYSDLLKIKK